MSDFSDIELFKGKNLSNLFEEIYSNSVSKREQIKDLIASLSPLIEGIGDATILVPLIKDYLDIGVKNDEQLVKLAQIVQRVSSDKKASSGDSEWWMMDTDIQNLVQDAEKTDKNLEESLERAQKTSESCIKQVSQSCLS